MELRTSASYKKQFRKLPQGSLTEAIKAVLEATPTPNDEDVKASDDNGVSLRLKMKMEWHFNLIAAVVTRFIFCVCGMKLQGNHHYGNTRFSREQGLELIKLAKLDEIFSLKALGGGVGSHGHGRCARDEHDPAHRGRFNANHGAILSEGDYTQRRARRRAPVMGVPL